MCGDCGCQEANREFFPTKEISTIHMAKDILEKNNHIAHHNHHWFHDHHICALNMMSSPGAGKTALLERTLKDLKEKISMTTLVGDQQTDNDATRLQLAGGKVRQIATHSSCHLDASMVEKELKDFVNEATDILFIENVGNLVCPSAFDLGENRRVALLSTTEGEDKPVKYPVLFNKVHLVILTKMDLVPYLDWDKEKCIEYIRQVNPTAQIIELSTKTGEGLEDWYQYVLSCPR